MKGGVLEVLLVSAKDIGQTTLLGSPAYYVKIECGTQERVTKVSSGDHENAWWNEKFTFELPSSDWKSITHIKFRIMETEFLNNESVGETVYGFHFILQNDAPVPFSHLKGYKRGFIEVKPALYNVVLDDDTYKGEIKIGFKFFPQEEILVREARKCIADKNKPRRTIWGNVVNLWRMVWFKLLCFCDQKNSSNTLKRY